jgi:hypothetical protein
VVSSETIALTLSPDPIPVEVMRALPAAAPEVDALVVLDVVEMAELMTVFVPVLDYAIYRRCTSGL